MSNGRRLAAALIALAASLHAVPASADQEVVIPGRVVDADSTPVAGVPVLLHRVTPAGGALLSETVSDSAGQFELRFAGPPEADAIYFAGARYGQELYIGPMLRPPLPTDQPYVLQIGVPATSALRTLGAAPPPPSIPLEPAAPTGGRLWALALFPLAMLIALGGFLMDRRVPSERRRLLIELATLEEADSRSEHEADREARERLRRRIRASAID
jgi:hypothetical protein